MPPQPLTRFRRRKRGGINIEHIAVAERPKQAAMVMQVVSIWSHIDHLYAIMITNFLGSDFETVMEMLKALSSSDGRRAAIKAAARNVLPPKDFTLYEVIEKAIKPSRDRRNEYAHHLWGFADQFPDALLLIDPRHLAEHHAKTETISLMVRYQVEIDPADHPQLDLSKVFVYREKDIKEDLALAKQAYGFVFELRFALSNHPGSAEARSRLLSQPQVQQALQQRSSENAQ